MLAAFDGPMRASTRTVEAGEGHHKPWSDPAAINLSVLMPTRLAPKRGKPAPIGPG